MRPFRRIVAVLLLLGLLVGIWKYQVIYEWWFLNNYTPSPPIAALADKAAMNDAGRGYFYITDPKLDSKADFGTHCPITEKSLVLGCYTGKIYVLDVDRPEL